MPGERLDGWKAIAEHLDVSERTAKRYERDRKLPVRRKAGARPLVYAYAEEIAEWWARSDRDRRRRRFASLPHWKSLAARSLGALALIAAASWLVVRSETPQRMATLEYLHQSNIGTARHLSVYGATGQLLAVRSFDNDVVQAALADVDGGEQLILVSFGEGAPYREGRLVAFTSDWEARWEFDTFDVERMREIRALGHTHSDYLRVTDVLPALLRGRRVVLAIAQDQAWFPSRILLIDLGTGGKIADYYVSGKVGYGDAVLADLDGDGDSELVVSGFNNDLQGELVGHNDPSPVVFALDLEEFASWRSAQIWPPRWPSLPITQPSWYLLFPALPGEPGTIDYLDVQDQGGDGAEEIVVVTAEGRHYVLDGDGDVTMSDARQSWFDRWGLATPIPEPIRLGHFGAALYDCWRRNPEPARSSLAAAAQAGEISEMEANRWRVRCAEITASDADGLGGIILNRTWDEPPMVREIVPGSQADRLGIRAGDAILAVDGRTVDDGHDLRYRWQLTSADARRLLIERRGERLQFDVPRVDVGTKQ